MGNDIVEEVADEPSVCIGGVFSSDNLRSRRVSREGSDTSFIGLEMVGSSSSSDM
jgi:hypothetical protein